jgi:hypothetical protein
MANDKDNPPTSLHEHRMLVRGFGASEKRERSRHEAFINKLPLSVNVALKKLSLDYEILAAPHFKRLLAETWELCSDMTPDGIHFDFAVARTEFELDKNEHPLWKNLKDKVIYLTYKNGLRPNRTEMELIAQDIMTDADRRLYAKFFRSFLIEKGIPVAAIDRYLPPELFYSPDIEQTVLYSEATRPAPAGGGILPFVPKPK